MRRSFLLSLALLSSVLAACESAAAGRPASPPLTAGARAATLPLEEQVKLLSGASRPGPKHAALAELSGAWDVALSVVAPGGSEAEPYRGHATLEPILGGRFLKWEATIEFGGVPGTTTGFLGFDTRYEEYVLLMISDLSQGMGVARGAGDLSGSGIVFTLEQMDPRSGAKVRARSRIRRIEGNHFVLEQLEAAENGTEVATRIWHYRRAAAVKR